MRISTVFLSISAFVAAAILSYFAATAAVTVVEERSVLAVRETFLDNGFDWASVQGDGLQVILEGTAPSEAMRFRAISTSGTLVDASRVIDNMRVVDRAAVAAPKFTIEILRNDAGVSLIGLIPASADREKITEQIAGVAGQSEVTDLLQAADYPVPDGWQPALDLGLLALAALPRSKISITSGRVDGTAISDSPEQKNRWERLLMRQVTDGVLLGLDISAPRPVITPFTIRFSKDASGTHFDACSADTLSTSAEIMAAARAAGLSARTDCQIGLGVPSRTWARTVALAIEAVDELGGGTLTFSDTDITLVALQGTTQTNFDTVVGTLEHALPPVFALEATLPVVATDTDAGIPQFTATLSPEGQVQLRGRVSDEMLKTVVGNYARARFGADQVTMGTRVADGLPNGWSVRVLAGIEALTELSNGSVVVEPEKLTVHGNTGNTTASDVITALLIEKLGDAALFEIDVTYVEQLDPIAGLPTPQECIEQIIGLTETRKITFEPSSATIDVAAQGLVDDIAEIMRLCSDLRIEVAGYTDSQGREIMNQQLSQERATAVLTALRGRRVPTAKFRAVGYGEEDPIADNDTEEGREANRRIEFRLIVPENNEEPTALEQLEAPLPETDAVEEQPATQAETESNE